MQACGPTATTGIILADDPAAVAHQIDEKVEHLGFATNSAPRRNSRRLVSSR